jgi:hypothetical protein
MICSEIHQIHGLPVVNHSDGDKNACDMGPDHDEVKKTIRKYITTPSHLLDPDFSKPLVGLFGIPIQHPEALYMLFMQ